MAVNIISRSAAEALIEQQLIAAIQQDTPKTSIFQQLARRLPNMTSNQTRMRVLDVLPMAYWVDGDTGMKQTSKQAWDNVYIDAAELAVIVPIPEAVYPKMHRQRQPMCGGLLSVDAPRLRSAAVRHRQMRSSAECSRRQS